MPAPQPLDIVRQAFEELRRRQDVHRLAAPLDPSSGEFTVPPVEGALSQQAWLHRPTATGGLLSQLLNQPAGTTTSARQPEWAGMGAAAASTAPYVAELYERAIGRERDVTGQTGVLAALATPGAAVELTGTVGLGPQNQLGYLESVTRGLGAGVGSIFDLGGALAQALGLSNTGDALRAFGQHITRSALAGVPEDVLRRIYGGPGEIVSDPRILLYHLAQVAPTVAATLATGAAGALLGPAAGLSSTAGALIGTTAAGTGLTFADAAAGTYDEVRALLRSLDPETFEQVPAVQRLRAENPDLERDQIIDQLALDASRIAGALSVPFGVGGGLALGALFQGFEKSFGPGIGRIISKTFLRRIAAGTALEGAAEALEEGGTELASQLAMRGMGIKQVEGQPILEAALSGAVIGGPCAASLRRYPPACRPQRRSCPVHRAARVHRRRPHHRCLL